MSTKRILYSMPWLLVGALCLTLACGGSGDDDDDQANLTGNNATGGVNGSTSPGNNFGSVNTSNTATTGNTLIQSNDNCEDIEPEAGAECSESGLFCMDASGLGCTCGGSDRFPEGIWTCRGSLGSGGAPGAGGAGGASGENAGGAAGADAG